MIRSLLCTALAIFVLTASAQQDDGAKRGTLKGTVVDAAGGPIPTAFVLVHQSPANDKHGYPDQRGSFDVELAPGLYDVFIAADGFEPRCKVIEIKASQVTRYHVVLPIDEEHMQGTLVK